MRGPGRSGRASARGSVRAALAGSLALAAAMGIGRFAYTALLPPTQAALGLDDAAAGAIASANLVGYLVGVLAARGLVAGPVRAHSLRAGLAATAVATALLVAASSALAWALLRFAAGVASGLVFVIASAAALEVKREADVPHPGLLYSGVGAGIALTGLAAALLAGEGWRTPWLLLAAAAGVLAIPGWRILAAPAPARAGPPPAVSSDAERRAGASERPPFSLERLGAAYFLEGLGYIVSGTFAVVAVRRTPGLEPLAPWTWALTGLAAAPSALLWAALGRRAGLRATLVLAFMLQAGGMVLPSLSRSAAAALSGAILFGGTFVGIVTLTMTAARAIAPGALGRAVGTLTALYGVGQIAGPIGAGILSRRVGDARPAVLAAAVAVAIGGLLLAWPARRISAAT